MLRETLNPSSYASIIGGERGGQIAGGILRSQRCSFGLCHSLALSLWTNLTTFWFSAFHLLKHMRQCTLFFWSVEKIDQYLFQMCLKQMMLSFFKRLPEMKNWDRNCINRSHPFIFLSISFFISRAIYSKRSWNRNKPLHCSVTGDHRPEL